MVTERSFMSDRMPGAPCGRATSGSHLSVPPSWTRAQKLGSARAALVVRPAVRFAARRQQPRQLTPLLRRQGAEDRFGRSPPAWAIRSSKSAPSSVRETRTERRSRGSVALTTRFAASRSSTTEVAVRGTTSRAAAMSAIRTGRPTATIWRMTRTWAGVKPIGPSSAIELRRSRREVRTSSSASWAESSSLGEDLPAGRVP